MLKIKKGDNVQVITGKDKGKKGKVLRITRSQGRALVEGINIMKKHMRRTRQDQQQSGIVSLEATLSISNLMVICKNCNRPARVAFSITKDGSKNRVCQKCKEVI